VSCAVEAGFTEEFLNLVESPDIEGCDSVAVCCAVLQCITHIYTHTKCGVTLCSRW